jgi:predicted PurR-regulated permease PerM
MFLRRCLTVALVALLTTAFAILMWLAHDVVLVAFGGVLVALVLRGAADTVARWLRIGPAPALAVVVLAIIAVVSGAFILFADDVVAQAEELAHRLPDAVSTVRDRLGQSEWGRALLRRMPDPSELDTSRTLSRTTGALVSTLGVGFGLLVNVVVGLAVALYVAANPAVYVDGVTRLVPPARRARARAVLRAIAATLRRWLVGKLVAMAAIATVTAAGLAVIGVPLAIALGVLAGLLNFIPYLGPMLSFGPALLLAIPRGSTTVLWTLALYVFVQALESYLLSPLLAQRTVWLPPALTILAQVAAGVILGWMGIVLAAPLTAVALVLVKMLYVEDMLGERVELPGQRAPDRARAA